MNLKSVVLGASVAILAGRWASGQSDPPTYVNVELVAVDPSRRVVVIKDSTGAQRTLQMDDLLAGATGVNPGDRVTLTLRGGAGVTRVSAITRATANPGVVVAGAVPQGTTRASTRDRARARAREAFARQVATLSREAQSTDGTWTSFVASCNVKPGSANGGRAWFGLWDGRVQADYSNGTCRELFNQIVASGEAIKKGMAAADDVARKTLTPGEIRDIRQRNRMNWDGWTLAPPQRREP